MTIESDITAALAAVCPRVFPVLAPLGAQRPYLTLQNVGGPPSYYVEKAPANVRRRRFFVKAWASSKAEALALIEQVELAMVAATAFITDVESEPLDDVETDAEPWLYSELQEFLVTAPR